MGTQPLSANMVVVSLRLSDLRWVWSFYIGVTTLGVGVDPTASKAPRVVHLWHGIFDTPRACVARA